MKILLIAILFICSGVNAQTKFHLSTKKVVLQIISGTADGFNQAIIHHHYGQGKRFWDADSSWENKYRNWPYDKRETFPGSKTIFVAATDAYHLTRFIDRASMFTTIAISIGELKKVGWKSALKESLILALINRIAFSIFFHLL